MRRSGIVIMGKLIGLIKPLLHYMVLAIFLGTAGYLCAIFIPVLGGFGILHGIEKVYGFELGNRSAGSVPVAMIIILLISAAVLRGILHYAEQACNHYIAFKLLAVIRHRVFAALRKLAPAKLEGKEKGNLIAVITSDIELLEVFYAHTVSPVAIALMVSVIMVCFIGSYHPLLGMLAAIGYITVGVGIPLLTSRIGKEEGMKYRNDFGEMNSFFLDSLRGLAESIQYRTVDKRLKEINERTDRLNREQEKLKGNEAGNRAATSLVILLFDIIALFISVFLYQKGVIDFGGAVVSTIAMMSSFGPVIAISSLSNNLLLTLASGERILEILEETPEVEIVTGMEKTEFTGAAAEDVSFAYQDDIILRNVSLDIPENRIIGINGKSGSGKSTLLKLLMRFWNVKQGRITISKRDINQVNTVNLAKMEGYVTQETCMFHDTIAANISIGKPGASIEEIIEAAKKASVHKFIESLPKGYETKVSELGDSLSGGERQRIGIARAFLHDAPLLLLDEPTSNLDSLNEGIILKSLCEACENKTIVLVSHRESTMRIAERVYQMDAGRVS